MGTPEKAKAGRITTSWVHWLIAALLIAVGVVFGDWLGKRMILERITYPIYGRLQAVNPRPLRPRRTVLVLVRDEEFWGERLAHRTPISREYLAEVIRALSNADPELIALDIAMPSTSPGSSNESVQYQQETNTLMQAIREASKKTKLVLATTVDKAQDVDVYSTEPTVLDALNSEGLNVARGYVNPPRDMRRVALTMPSMNNDRIDSFATAAVRLVDKTAVAEAERNRVGALPFGSFIKPGDFSQYSTSEILTADVATLRSEIGCKIVLVGGVWHETPLGRPYERDLFDTPVGKIEGVFVHANFIEALLDSRTYKPLKHWIGILLDVIASILVALVLALSWSLWRRLRLMLVICFSLMLLSYILWQNVGVFFDSFIPIGLLATHVVLEKLARS